MSENVVEAAAISERIRIMQQLRAEREQHRRLMDTDDVAVYPNGMAFERHCAVREIQTEIVNTLNDVIDKLEQSLLSIPSDEELVLWAARQYIPAIKTLRTRTGLGLHEAKTVLEAAAKQEQG